MTVSLPVTDHSTAREYPKAVPALLAFVAGYVDATTFLAFSGLFVAQTTGSFVVAGTIVDTGSAAFVKVAAIPVFFLAGIATTAVVRAFKAEQANALAIALLTEALLIAGLLLTAVANPTDGTVAPLLGLAAMGVQSVTARLLLTGYGSTNVMTTNLTQFSIDLEDSIAGYVHGTPARAAMNNAERLGAIILAFLAGVIVGALGYRVTGMIGLALMVATLMGLAVWAVSPANALNRDGEGRHNG